MAETIVLPFEVRQSKGTRKAEKLRKSGQTPGVLYGHEQGTVSVAVSHNALLNAVMLHHARVVDLQGQGKTQKALIKALQWDYLGKDILHVDFERVEADERIKVTVPLEIKGIAPGVAAGGSLDQPLHNLHIECLAVAIPDSIRVLINELQKGQAIHVRDLKLPEGVTALDDADAIVIHVTEPQSETTPTEGEATTAEPEIITRRPTAEEAEEK